MSDPNTEQPQILDQAVPADAPVINGEGAALADEPIDPENSGKSPEQLLHEVLASPLPDGSEEIPLPSGVVCFMRPGKGRDLLAAQRVAGSDPHQIMYGLIASLCTFDGQKKVLEDVLEMPLGDVMKLTGKIGDQAGGDFLPSTSGPSSTSQP